MLQRNINYNGSDFHAVAFPHYASDAELLRRIMALPIHQNDAESWLENICWSYKLQDIISDSLTPEDIRPHIQDLLSGWLDDLDRFYLTWDQESIEICKKLVAD